MIDSMFDGLPKDFIDAIEKKYAYLPKIACTGKELRGEPLNEMEQDYVRIRKSTLGDQDKLRGDICNYRIAHRIPCLHCDGTSVSLCETYPFLRSLVSDTSHDRSS